MAKKKAKSKKSELEKVLEKVKKQLAKLEALHAKEDEVVEALDEIVEDALYNGDDDDWK